MTAPAGSAAAAGAVARPTTSPPAPSAAGKVTPVKPVARPDRTADSKPEPKADAKADNKGDARADAKAAKPDAKADTKSDAKSDSKAPEGRFVVQVGSFADEAHARDARAKLERAGLKNYTQVVETKDGKRIRVRAGPYASKAEAERVIERIRKMDLQAALLVL